MSSSPDDGVVTERCEGADHRPAPIDVEEGVAVPHRDDEGFARGVGQEHPHASGRQWRFEAGQCRPMERYSHQVRRAQFRAGDGGFEEGRRFAPDPRFGRRSYDVTFSSAGSKLTAAVSTTPAVRPGADCHDQYRLVCEITLSGVGAPHSERSSVVWASPTRTAS